MANLLTPQQLADQFKCHVKTVYRLVAEGKLRAVRLPGSKLLRFEPDNLTYTEAEVRAREAQGRRAAQAIVARHNERRRQRTAKQIVHPPCRRVTRRIEFQNLALRIWPVRNGGHFCFRPPSALCWLRPYPTFPKEKARHH